MSVDNSQPLVPERGDDFRDVPRCAGGRAEGERLKGVACEDGVRLAELGPDGRLAAPDRVVVHRRQVVVDEGVVVEKLYRRSGVFRILLPAADGQGRCEAYERTDPLAACADGPAHGVRKHGGALLGIGQHLVQRLFYQFQQLFLVFHAIYSTEEIIPNPPRGRAEKK